MKYDMGGGAMNSDILKRVLEELKKRGKKKRRKEDEDEKIAPPVPVTGRH